MHTLEDSVNVLQFHIDENLIYKINSLMAKLEKILKLNEEEAVSVCINHMLQAEEDREEERAIRILSERIELLKPLCSVFEVYNLTDARFYSIYKFIIDEALIGARKHIINEHPRLAIAAYHNNIDIFRLAQLIAEMDSEYRFYYRYYGSNLYPY